MMVRAWPLGPAERGVDPPQDAVDRAVRLALSEDLDTRGDLTGALIPEDRRAHLSIRARTDGVLAGRLCALGVLREVDPGIEVDWLLPDGSPVSPGSVIARLDGSFRSLLTAERSALNFLGHLSGIATLTHRYVIAVQAINPEVLVLDTRKTTPGLRLLEKAAVRAGGGTNHRMSLSEAVLIKDNHLGALSIAGAVAQARGLWPGTFVEVECDRLEQATEAVRAGAEAILLDNMSPQEVTQCVSIVRAEPGGGTLLVEVSGGMTLERAPQYAASGADAISIGSLTHSAPSLDLGLDLETP
jgi:nicotinate-nucleotide pyrophosphorylase (carboxylating)